METSEQLYLLKLKSCESQTGCFENQLNFDTGNKMKGSLESNSIIIGPVKGSDQAKSQLQNGALINSQTSNSFDWQSATSELKEGFEYIFNNQLFCDVHFIVGSGTAVEKISAHKLVLLARSVVFYTMFSKKWSADCTEIEVSDVTPGTFTEMLKFIYSEKVNLTPDTVIEIMYTAKKYAVRALEKKCADFLQNELSPENAFTILIQARLFDEEKLTEACLKVISNNITDALKTDDFCNIDAETLCLLLKRSDLAIGEIDLFEAVVRWSEAACMKQNLPLDPKNQRSVLKNAVSFMRFPLMLTEEFTSKVIKSGILLEKEIISVLLYFLQKLEFCDSFSTTSRRGFYVASRYEKESGPGLFGGSNTHSIIFSSDCNIKLIGVGLYGSPDKPAEYTVSVTLKDYGKDQVLSQEIDAYDGMGKIFRVVFKKPVNLTANAKYKFEIKILGSYLLNGSAGKASVTVNVCPDKNVNFRFFNHNDPDYAHNHIGNLTYIQHGQIPEILFYL